MSAPKLAILVNGNAASIEAVRAKGLSQNHPGERLRILLREGQRSEVATHWQRTLQDFQPDLLYVLNTALPGIQVAWQWRARHGVPFVLDTGDAVYEMARSAGTAPWWKLPLLWAGERRAQRKAAAIVVRGTKHQEHLEQLGFRHVSVIRDGFVDRGEVDPAAVSALRTRLGLNGRFVAGLMGSLVYSPKLEICYGWDLVRALAQVRDLPVSGLVIGDGPGRVWLETRARELGVADRVVFCGRIAYEDVPLYLQLLDVALTTQTNNLPGQVRTTGKLPEYMAARRFIIASRVGEAALVLPEEMLLNYDGAVDEGYPDQLAAKIRELVAKPEQLGMRHALPHQACKLFSYEVLSRVFDEVVATASKARP